METILNNLQERLNAHNNRLTGDGFKMLEFAYTSFGDLNNDALKEISRGVFGLFVNNCHLCVFCNMDYTSKSYLLEKVKKVRGLGFKSSGEALVASTFD